MALISVFMRPTQDADIEKIAPLIRADDVREIMASGLLAPAAGVAQSVYASEATWTGFVRGEIAFICGIVRPSFYSERRIPWLLGTDEIDRNALVFARFTKRHIRKLRVKYPIMENYVDARNTKTIEWLRWLGFAIHEAEPYGALRRPFHRFTMDATECANRSL